MSGDGNATTWEGKNDDDNDDILVRLSLFRAWLPDGYSQIFRSYVFGHSGFWTIALQRYIAKFHPFLSFLGLRQGGGRGGAIQGKEGIKFCSAA